MANTKKTTNAKPEDEILDETVQEPAADGELAANEATEEDAPDVLDTINKTVDAVSGVSVKENKSRKADIALDEEIAVRSVTFGGLSWISPKSNAHYRWNEIGAVEYIPFSDLVAMNNTTQAFLTEPYIILQDKRAVDYFRLAPVYEKIAVVNSLEELFKEGNLTKIEKALRDIRNTSMRNVAISKIKELRETHTLNNIDVIRLIEKILCFDME